MLKLTLDQEGALSHLVETRRNIFLTGSAGTGKTYLVKKFLERTEEKIPILASTGAAALLLGGRTFHSFFGLGILQGGVDKVIEKAMDDRRLKKRLKESKSILIDEVSMLSWEVFDCAERIASILRESDEPWGGLRIIAVGDFAQLPPVSRSKYFEDGLSSRKKEWAFLGEAWAKSQFKMISLTEIVRAEDEEFIPLLEDLRLGNWSVRLEHFLKTSKDKEVDAGATCLFPRREQADRFNKEKLSQLKGELRKYPTEYQGLEQYFDRLAKEAPIPEVLELKEGAFVMLRMNDPKQRFVNGTTGIVERMGQFSLKIKLEKKSVEIEPFTFTWLDADGFEVASARNFPLSLAYASTIHKAQGATIDRVHADLTGLWEPGQAYVAVSRVRRRADFSCEGFTRNSIMADQTVQAFYDGVATAEPFRANNYL